MIADEDWRKQSYEDESRREQVMRVSRFTALASVLLLNILLTASWAQTTQGGIVGTVQDQKGDAIANTKVTVINAATGLQRDVTSADNGIFRVIAIPNGMYEVRAEAPGFATLVAKDIEIGVAQTRTLDLVLKVGATAETVTVEANADLTQTESSKLGQIIDNRKVEDLPLNGRDFAQLARLNPGVAVSGGGGGQQGGEGNVSGFSSNGQRSTSNNFLVDGVDNNTTLRVKPRSCLRSIPFRNLKSRPILLRPSTVATPARSSTW